MTDAPEARATDDAPLSDDAAIELLTEKKPEEAEPEEPVEAEEPEDAQEDPEPEEPEEEPEAVAPPPFWSAEDKAAFGNAPPEVQKAILEHEANRNRAAERFIQQQTEAANQYAAKTKALDALLEQAKLNEELFGQIDWPQWLRDNPGDALAAQHTAQQLAAAKAEAERIALANFRQEEGRKLPTIEPDLADPAKQQAVFAHLLQRGIPREQLEGAGAVELSIAYDAMRWRDAQAKAKAGKVRTPEPPRKPAKPTAAQPAATPQRQLQALRNRFAQTRSTEDAVELIRQAGL